MSNNNFVLENFVKATKRLEEVLGLERTEITRDSAIKRFELCFDLAWKAIKFYARDQGKECFSPRACLKEAFQLGLIDYDERWLKMIDDRNLTAHLYKEAMADKVYSKLPEHLGMFKGLVSRLQDSL